MNGYQIRRFKTANGNFFVYTVDTLPGKQARIIVGEGYYVDPAGDILPKKKGEKNPRRHSAVDEVNWAETTFGDDFHEEIIEGPLAQKLWGLFDLSIPKTRSFGAPKEPTSPFAGLASLKGKMDK